MSFPKYEQYVDSGVAWLGAVPAHWVTTRFSRVMVAIKDGTHGTFPRVGDGVPLLSAKNVQNGRLDITAAESLISESDHAEIVASGFPMKGDLLLTIVGTIGRSCVYEEDYALAFQRSVCFIRLRPNVSSKFFYYFSQSKFFQEHLLGKSKSSAQAGVYMGDVQATNVLFPPELAEQKAIVKFLDGEAGKIDALIAEQEKLLTLLAEKRQATISHAVTRGLDPMAPMKDSGVAWLGEVPAHWVRTPIKHVVKAIVDSEHKTATFYDDGQYLVIRTSNIKRGALVFDDAKYTDAKGYEEWTRRGKPEPGDIIFTREAPAGEACVVPEDLPVCLGQRTVLMKTDLSLLNPYYGLWSIYGGLASEFIALLGQGSTVSHFNMSDIGNIPVLLPPLAEQSSIVTFIEAEIARLDALKWESEHAIDVLKERRIALISAVVTGKIDVRGAGTSSVSKVEELTA